jgi:hypothetical protein
MTTSPELSPLQTRFVIEAIFTALAEIEQSEDFSQGAADGLYESLRILGVKNADIKAELAR